MSAPELALYVSSNGMDHGPLSLKETTERVRSGEFEPTDGSTPPMGSSPKKIKIREGSQVQTKSSTQMDGFSDEKAEEQVPQSGGLASKLLIAFALLIFLAALGIMGLYCYNNWDQILLELQ